ncbi:hypothetical protein SAY86_004600 [Trapa natans]|uniref:TIR domain-containing protein n=1 Tax=Trapa natans TaxID=22666 RepID=A0AAN7RQK4_TRANT|nr:hypothetical protein SAY86_004600 [Trapa natans]
MQHRNLTRIMKLQQQHLILNGHRNHQTGALALVADHCDVFINHRGVDTKRNMASLLYHHLSLLNVRSFLDMNTLKPGDCLSERIQNAIRDCKVGIAVFSPNYGSSYYCLLELALMMEMKKKIIPVFFDVMPSEIHVNPRQMHCTSGEIQRFHRALEEAKMAVGLVFNSLKGNWSDVLTTTSDIVMKRLTEIDGK